MTDGDRADHVAAEPRAGSTRLVCFAVKEEAVFFRPWARSQSDVQVLVTDMGRKNAEESFLQALSVALPRFVLTCGFAGGLDPNLKCGDVVYETDDSAALQQALARSGVRAGRFHCVDSVAVTAASKLDLRRQTGADGVEMESGAIRAIAREKGIPSATLRVILDTAEEDLPLDFNRLMTPDMRMDPVKLGLSLARSPGKIPGLIRFGKRTRTAAQALASALEQVLAHNEPR
jgi:adenosylhomocysteine nucleosidase